MCLAAIALQAQARFPFVVAANRDEFFQREAAAMDWWTPGPGARPLLAGRDLSAGGTWLALDGRGRLALVTNVREPGRHSGLAPSRGQLPVEWVGGTARASAFAAGLFGRGHNGFNLLVHDAVTGESHWIGNRPPESSPPVIGLAAGVHGVSNASLDTPWPKLVALKRRLADALAADPDLDALSARLWLALADAEPAPDPLLPDTGIGRMRERWLSSAFIRVPGADDPELADYGTRASTLVIAERIGPDGVDVKADAPLRLHVLERRYAPTGTICGESRFRIDDWPSRNRA